MRGGSLGDELTATVFFFFFKGGPSKDLAFFCFLWSFLEGSGVVGCGDDAGSLDIEADGAAFNMEEGGLGRSTASKAFFQRPALRRSARILQVCLEKA